MHVGRFLSRRTWVCNLVTFYVSISKNYKNIITRISYARKSLQHQHARIYRYENYLCENKTEYNSMATLMLQPQEEVIEALFHDYTPAGEFAFRPGDLIVYFMLYFFISAYTFGISVPAGLFVPAILCGSSFGRLVGEAVQHWADDDSIRPGTYALIGATAMLGGT